MIYIIYFSGMENWRNRDMGGMGGGEMKEKRSRREGRERRVSVCIKEGGGWGGFNEDSTEMDRLE